VSRVLRAASAFFILCVCGNAVARPDDFFGLEHNHFRLPDWSIGSELFQDTSPIKGSFSFQGGLLQTTQLNAANASTGASFHGVYGARQLFLDFGYDYHLFHALGPVSLRGGLGFMFDSGSGLIRNEDNTGYDSVRLSGYNFFSIPISVGASYMFNSGAHWQVLYPYATAMISYFPFFELRKDGGGFHGGGNLHTQFGAGLRFLLDWINPKGAYLLDKYRGINNIYLQVEYRRLVSLTASNFDFSGNLFLAGFAFDM
jgi:hypothetical protein